MSVGFGLIVKMLNEGVSPAVLADLGLSIEPHFVGDEKETLTFIKQFFAKHSNLPSKETIENEIQVVIPDMQDEPFSYWADRIQDRHLHNISLALSRKIQELLNKSKPKEVAELIQNTAAKLYQSYNHGIRTGMCSLIPAVIGQHKKTQTLSGMLGVPFGFPYIDVVTGGAQPGDLVLIVGKTGSGKTFLLLAMALAAFLTGRRVLFVTNEMTKEQCASRLAAMAASIPHTLLRLGKVSAFGMQAMQDRLANIFLAEEDRFHFMDGGMNGTMDDIIINAKDHKADVVYNDGLYLTTPSERVKGGEWEKTTQVAKEHKAMAISMRIPIIASTQHNRDAEGKKGGSVRTMGYSYALAQLATILLDISDKDVADGYSINTIRKKIIRFLKGRNGESGAIEIVYNMMRTTIYQSDLLIENDGQDSMFDYNDLI